MAYVPIFTYDPNGNLLIFYVRLLISDTVEFAPDGTTPIFVFSDQEIMGMSQIVSMQFQSAQFYTPPAGRNLPSRPVNYLRIAAQLIDSMATNAAKLAAITRILDVTLDPAKAAQWLREQAQQYRDTDDNSGSFMIIEQVNNQWALSQRYWNQIQRQQGQGFSS